MVVEAEEKKAEVEGKSMAYSCSDEDIYLQESKLRAEANDLFNELMVMEAEEKKAEEEYKSGYESLQCEVEKLRKSDAEKSSRISQLTSENINLKKNICSLFKTAKSEIERKDFLLKQANRKLDGLLFKRHNFCNQNVRREAHSNLTSKEASSKDGWQVCNELKERVSKSGSSKKKLDGADTPRRKNVTPISKTRDEKKSQVKITKVIKDNVIKLYQYNQEKIPFLVKRKYGL